MTAARPPRQAISADGVARCAARDPNDQRASAATPSKRITTKTKPAKTPRKTASSSSKTVAFKTAPSRTTKSKTTSSKTASSKAAPISACPRRRVVNPSRDPPASVSLLDRVTRAIERQLCQIEQIVGGEPSNPAERSDAESRARTLASLARSLTELRKLRAEEQANRPDDDAIPRDLDELRHALSRRLEQMVADAAEFPAGRDE